MPMFKAGVVMWHMAPQIEEKLPAIDAAHLRMVDRLAIITAARDGLHSKASLHYKGRAIDLRTNDIPKSKHAPLVAALKEALGAGYDVVLEPDHIHLEWDPK